MASGSQRWVQGQWDLPGVACAGQCTVTHTSHLAADSCRHFLVSTHHEIRDRLLGSSIMTLSSAGWGLPLVSASEASCKLQRGPSESNKDHRCLLVFVSVVPIFSPHSHDSPTSRVGWRWHSQGTAESSLPPHGSCQRATGCPRMN